MTPKNLSRLREPIYIAILACYLLPIFLFSRYVLLLLGPSQPSWSALSSGLVVALMGSLLLIVLMKKWETSLRQQIKDNRVVPIPLSAVSPSVKEATKEAAPVAGHLSSTDPSPQEAEVARLQLIELQQQLQQCQKQHEQQGDEIKNHLHQIRQIHQEKEASRQQLEYLKQELDNCRQATQAKLEAYEKAEAEYRKTIEEQSHSLEGKQQTIVELENKVRDLNYEVKTLLQLSDIPISPTPPGTDGYSHAPDALFHDAEALPAAWSVNLDPQTATLHHAAIQLQKYIEKAQQMTGAAHLSGSPSRFRDLSIDSYAIDLRRLCDLLRNEGSSILLLYSKNEEKLLFVNPLIKGLVGWSQEKFTHDFFDLIQQGGAEFKKVAQGLTPGHPIQASLIIKTKSGQDILTQCHLGIVPSGLFANHILGVLNPDCP